MWHGGSVTEREILRIACFTFSDKFFLIFLCRFFTVLDVSLWKVSDSFSTPHILISSYLFLYQSYASQSTPSFSSLSLVHLSIHFFLFRSIPLFVHHSFPLVFHRISYAEIKSIVCGSHYKQFCFFDFRFLVSGLME